MSIYTPYVYLIGWSKQDRYYIGSRYAAVSSIANPTDLWTTYFTSSGTIIQPFAEEHGDPDIIWVLKTFADGEAAYKYESKILQRLDALNHPKLLNGHNNDGNFSHYLSHHTPETKKKISIKAKGRPSPRKGVTLSTETKDKISKANKGNKSHSGSKAITDGQKLSFIFANDAMPAGWYYGIPNQMRQRQSYAQSGRNNNNAKTALFISPDGTGYIIRGALKAFLNTHGLQYTLITKTTHKGWIGMYL
jgi:hypothetical protein